MARWGFGYGNSRGGSFVLKLRQLLLTSSSIPENTGAGVLVGALSNTRAGSTFSLIDSAGSRFALSGTNINTGATATNFEAGTSHNITVRETNAGFPNSPRDSVITIAVSNVFEAANLGALTLSDTVFSTVSSESGTINGATSGSTITGSGFPAGFTIDGAARTWTWAGGGTISTPSITLTETLADSANSPRQSVIGLTINNDVIPGPTNLTAPAVTGTDTLTTTNGTWSGSPTSYTYQWQRDGVNISGQTASTYTYVAATDDGRYIQAVVTATNASGSTPATSNAVIAGENATYYTTSFVAANNTTVDGFEGWTASANPANATIIGNDFNAAANLDSLYFSHAAGSVDHDVEAKVIYSPTGANGTNTQRVLNARYTNTLNFVYLAWSNNGYTIGHRVAGGYTDIATVLVGHASGDTIKLRVFGNYARVYKNGLETAHSAAANGGLGYNVSACPQIAQVAVQAGPNSGLSFPYPVYTDAAIYNILSDAIVISTAAVENIDATIGRLRIRLTGTETGDVTQLQALVLSPTGQVLLDWANVSGLSGGAYEVVTGELPTSVSGTSPVVWLRDATNKEVATSVVVPVAVEPALEDMIIGINENSLGYYDVASSISWIENGSYGNQIVQRGRIATAPEIASSGDGAGSTVQRGWDGSIGVNGLGITTYGMVYNNTNLPASEAGNWTIRFPAGTSITGVTVGNGDSWTYNSGTGVGTFNWNTGNVVLDLRIDVASLTAAGLALVSLKKTSVGSAIINPQTAINVAQLASSIRLLDSTDVNNDDIAPDRTQLVHPSRTVAQREQRLGKRREDVVLHCNTIGATIYHNHRLFDSDALIEDDANYYLQNLAAGDINVSLSNEIWNFIFKQTTDVREAGVRAGFAPIGVTDPSMAVPETVYSTQYPTVTTTGSGSTRNTTVAYLNGEKFIYNGFSGIQVYQAIGDQPIGAGFQETTNANFSVIYDNVATARAGDRWVATRLARIREIWDDRAAFYGRARPIYWIEGQAAGGTLSVFKYLNFNNFHLVADGISAAHYWGNGVGGAVNPGSYTSTTTGFTPADKELLYTTADQTDAINTLKDKFFAVAQTAFVDPVGVNVRLWKREIAAYAISKGLDKDHYKFGQYEMNHHLVLQGWPDEAGAWSSGTAYVVGDFAKDGGKIFKCILNHTNQATSNGTYWTEIASTTVTAQNRRDAWYISLLDDARFGTLMTYYYNMMKTSGGGLQHHYTRMNFQGANGSWGAMRNEDDTANVRFNALKDFKASL